MRGTLILLLGGLFLVSVVMMVVDSKTKPPKPAKEKSIYDKVWETGEAQPKPEFKPPPEKVPRQGHISHWPGWRLTSVISFVGLAFLVVQGRMNNDLMEMVGVAKKKPPPV